ncbi:hypothetical protein N805_15145 [Pseudomonas putida S13.1.2]|uniref:Uncharacterized protein n=2 Tax=Pseudomonas TaxID=286 RepID=A0AAU8S5J4_PSEPU|nr:hypothetical protein N805_15145 [Pseudomonas putida S13.1.2]
MAEYNFSELYAWLKEQPRALGWGMISFMDRKKLNLLLLQAYIQRFKTSAYLPPITGSIPNGDDRRFALNQFTLDWPRLGFAGMQANDSKAGLTMQVMSGTQLGLRLSGADWHVREIRETSPLQGPELSLDLLLANVPGVVGKEGRVRLDLKESSDFKLEVSSDAGEQRLVGEYFKQKFEALPDAQRVFPLGQIEAGGNPLLRATSFALRTQARERDPEDDEGAVLALLCYEGDDQGNIPGRDFRYLIPKDKAYDATVLFEPTRIMLAQLLESLKGVVNDVEFRLVRDDKGKLIGAIASRGEMVIPEQELTHEFDTDADDFGRSRHMTLKFKVFEIVLEMTDAFEVSINGQDVEVTWEVTGVMAVEPLDLDDDTGQVGRTIRTYMDSSDFYKRTEDDFKYVFKSLYELEDVEGGILKSKGIEMLEYKAPAPKIGEIKPPSVPPLDPIEAYIIAALFFWLLLPMIAVMIMLEGLLRATGETEFPSVESILRDAFEKNFQFSHSLKELVDETIKLYFGNALIGQDQFAPREIALFGAVNPAATAFAVDPMEHTLAVASSPKQFNTVPAHPGKLRWTCEPVLATVASDQIGDINPDTGLYTPPRGQDFDGAFVRVRVHAEHKDTGFKSSALITVVKSRVQINPLAYVTQVNGTVDLQAGYLGDANNLRWADPAYGKVNASGKSAVYTAPANMPPLDPAYPDELAAFTVDEIVLSEAGANGSGHTALVITESAIKQPMQLLREVDPVAGTVKLTAVINGREQDPAKIQWEVKYGSGAVDPATGVYTHDTSSSDQFALITATFDTQIIGIFDGYALQTLPPARLEDAVQGVGAFEVQKHPEGVKS